MAALLKLGWMCVCVYVYFCIWYTIDNSENQNSLVSSPMLIRVKEWIEQRRYLIRNVAKYFLKKMEYFKLQITVACYA